MTLQIDNPGSNRPWPTETPRRLVSRLIGYAKQKDWRGGWNALLTGVANLYNQYRPGVERYYCPCCQYAGRAFVHSSNHLRISWRSICPQCRSRGRHRGLASLLPELLQADCDYQVLHFAPEPILSPFLQGERVTYHTADLFLHDVDFPKEDIQALSFPDSSYDMVMANHVLEHVADDAKALREIARILRPKGVAVITVPGIWTRNETITLPDLSFNGHYRDYGLEFADLMREAFDTVEVVDMHRFDEVNAPLSCGIRPKELAFVGYVA